ncbi:ABC transporter permease [Clostridium kluyveri]|uniref:ABC transporter permease n=1 Tax=Clostridium kluyveri TaxID=1534 RepID=A0A1L5FAK5_CLOKL|nr:ABC transporter permease [Clostridium kluyveri]APM40051.1 ABC transporter permease [Clostridium kluyveri]UZQ49709.1 ABC transporter permease [Clostridium kluyveri]
MVNESIKKEEMMFEKNSTKDKLNNLLSVKWILVILPALFIIVFTFVPMISLFKLSIIDENGFTFKYIAQIFTEPIYLQVIWLTLKTSFIVTVISIVLAYPVAYFIIKTKSSRTKKVILMIIMIPFWISLLVRTFSWIIILQEQGILNTFLKNIGLINQPLDLLYNTASVTIGMTHVLFPYMVLNVYSVMSSIDTQLVEVAQVMGARPIKAFWQVFFPLSVPGILSGSILVFVLALGYFITPALLGGSKNMLVSTLIQNNISATLNWPLASALSLVLFIITMVLLSILAVLVKRNPMLKEGE